jgi:lipopolysaccharide biosynthesis glycosyltransferase
MESIVVHPENKEQLKAVKAFLKALKVDFEPQAEKLPQHVIEGIQRGIEQAKNGQTISLDEFKEKHFTKKDMLKYLSDDFIPEKTADEIVIELKAARNFTRESRSF